MAIPRARVEVDLRGLNNEDLNSSRVAAFQRMPTHRLRRLQMYQPLVGIHKRATRSDAGKQLVTLQAEIESRRRQLMQEVDLDKLISGE